MSNPRTGHEQPAPLTPSQARLFVYLTQYVAKRGYAPTLSEMGRAMHWRSMATVHGHLSVLERKGRIVREPGEVRAIRVLGKCPYCGHDNTAKEIA